MFTGGLNNFTGGGLTKDFYEHLTNESLFMVINVVLLITILVLCMLIYADISAHEDMKFYLAIFVPVLFASHLALDYKIFS